MKTVMASNMKHVASMALMFALGVASVHAQKSVKMTFSGTAGNSPVDIPYNYASYDEDNFAGTGTLGSFTLRNERALPNSPTPSSTCSGPDDLYFVEGPGEGIFRLEDGNLLYAQVTQGTDCINVVTNEAQCILTYQITGGTGRFKNASGTLELTETVVSELLDAGGNPIYYAATGKITGTISGVSEDQGQDEGH
jgi:hypothetical protein